MKSSTTVRTETRVVRPFLGLEHAEELVSQTQLQIGNSKFAAGTIVLPNHRLKERGFVLHLNVKKQDLIKACEEASVSPKNVQYIVFATSKMLRVSTLIYEYSLDSSREPESELHIDELADDELSRLVFLDSTGFDLYAVLMLANSDKEKALKPSRVGTWLSKAQFSIKPEVDVSSFAPEPLSDSVKVQFGLPRDCFSYIYLAENLLLTEDLSEVVTVYLDPEVLNLLLIDETDDVSKQIQISLVMQTIETILIGIVRALEEDGLTLDDLSTESGAIRFLDQLSANLKSTSEDLVDSVVSNPASIRASLEAHFKYRAIIEQLLKGGQ
jgi:hypothetical protein